MQYQGFDSTNRYVKLRSDQYQAFVSRLLAINHTYTCTYRIDVKKKIIIFVLLYRCIGSCERFVESQTTLQEVKIIYTVEGMNNKGE